MVVVVVVFIMVVVFYMTVNYIYSKKQEKWVKYNKKNNRKNQVLFLNAYKPSKKEKLGNEGEVEIIQSLKEEGITNIFHNLYIPLKGGNTSEIDILCVSRKGIIVIESKNLSGTVSGSVKKKDWQRSTKTGKGLVKSTFYNPIMQNQGHIWALMSALKLTEEYFKSVVVFSNRCDLKVESKDIFPMVIQTSDIAYLDKVLKGSKNCLSEAEVKVIYSKLSKYQYCSKKSKKKHIEYCNSKKGVLG